MYIIYSGLIGTRLPGAYNVGNDCNEVRDRVLLAADQTSKYNVVIWYLRSFFVSNLFVHI